MRLTKFSRLTCSQLRSARFADYVKNHFGQSKPVKSNTQTSVKGGCGLMSSVLISSGVPHYIHLHHFIALQGKKYRFPLLLFMPVRPPQKKREGQTESQHYCNKPQAG